MGPAKGAHHGNGEGVPKPHRENARKKNGHLEKGKQGNHPGKENPFGKVLSLPKGPEYTKRARKAIPNAPEIQMKNANRPGKNRTSQVKAKHVSQTWPAPETTPGSPPRTATETEAPGAPSYTLLPRKTAPFRRSPKNRHVQKGFSGTESRRVV